MIEASLSLGKGSSATVLMRDEYAPWLALGRVKGLGCAGFKKLAARFADPTQVFSASSSELEQVEGLHRDVIDALLNFSDWVDVDNEIRDRKSVVEGKSVVIGGRSCRQQER